MIECSKQVRVVECAREPRRNSLEVKIKYKLNLQASSTINKSEFGSPAVPGPMCSRASTIFMYSSTLPKATSLHVFAIQQLGACSEVCALCEVMAPFVSGTAFAMDKMPGPTSMHQDKTSSNCPQIDLLPVLLQRVKAPPWNTNPRITESRSIYSQILFSHVQSMKVFWLSLELCLLTARSRQVLAVKASVFENWVGLTLAG